MEEGFGLTHESLSFHISFNVKLDVNHKVHGAHHLNFPYMGMGCACSVQCTSRRSGHIACAAAEAQTQTKTPSAGEPPLLSHPKQTHAEPSLLPPICRHHGRLRRDVTVSHGGGDTIVVSCRKSDIVPLKRFYIGPSNTSYVIGCGDRMTTDPARRDVQDSAGLLSGRHSSSPLTTNRQ